MHISVSIMQKALADDFPSDLPRLIDGVAPNEKKMKNVFRFYLFIFLPPPPRPLGRGRQTDLQTTTLSSLCMSYKCSLIPHTHTHKSVFSGSNTHTYICCRCLNGWSERRASFAKVSVLDRLRRGDEWLIKARQGCRGNN